MSPKKRTMSFTKRDRTLHTKSRDMLRILELESDIRRLTDQLYEAKPNTACFWLEGPIISIRAVETGGARVTITTNIKDDRSVFSETAVTFHAVDASRWTKLGLNARVRVYLVSEIEKEWDDKAFCYLKDLRCLSAQRVDDLYAEEPTEPDYLVLFPCQHELGQLRNGEFDADLCIPTDGFDKVGAVLEALDVTLANDCDFRSDCVELWDDGDVLCACVSDDAGETWTVTEVSRELFGTECSFTVEVTE